MAAPLSVSNTGSTKADRTSSTLSFMIVSPCPSFTDNFPTKSSVALDTDIVRDLGPLFHFRADRRAKLLGCGSTEFGPKLQVPSLSRRLCDDGMRGGIELFYDRPSGCAPARTCPARRSIPPERPIQSGSARREAPANGWARQLPAHAACPTGCAATRSASRRSRAARGSRSDRCRPGSSA